MIENGFLICCCGKKIQPIFSQDILSATVYCHVCKKYWRVFIFDNRLHKFERAENPMKGVS